MSENPPKPPPRSSTTHTLPTLLFRSKSVLCFQQEVVIPSSPKLETFGKLQGIRRIFFVFCVDG